jgi:orotate phosphoribosyltransferase
MEQYCYDDSPSHLRTCLTVPYRKQLVDKCVRIRPKLPEFDAIAVTGISGMVCGTSLSDAWDVPLIVVRKDETPKAHSWRTVEGPDKRWFETQSLRWLLVDDLIASGTTYDRVSAAIASHYPNSGCVGILLYDLIGTRSCSRKFAEPIFTLGELMSEPSKPKPTLWQRLLAFPWKLQQISWSKSSRA